MDKSFFGGEDRRAGRVSYGQQLSRLGFELTAVQTKNKNRQTMIQEEWLW